MSDRSPLNLIVHACPPEQEQALLECMKRGQISEGYGFYEEPTELSLHTRYGADDMRLDSYGELALEIVDAAPGASFEVWNDPKYEYAGGITMYTPELGYFNGDCDSEGNPYITAYQYLNEGQAALRRLGLAWERRFQELRNGG